MTEKVDTMVRENRKIDEDFYEELEEILILSDCGVKATEVILEELRGNGGFGYDPLFLYEPLGKTFAELTDEEKNTISHRARACEKMKEIMREIHRDGR